MGASSRLIIETLRRAGPLWTVSLLLDRLVPFGVLGLWPDRAVSQDLLSRQIHHILGAWGVPPEHASVTARHMLFADLHGIDSEGCSMLLHYHRERANGSLKVGATVEVVCETDSTALIDGGGGLGHVTGDAAMRLAIEKCRKGGIGAAAARNSGHFGAAGVYASMAADAGLVGVATTSTREPALLPTFGSEPMLGTNPIAIAAPVARSRPFMLDMATSTGSIGSVRMAWRRGRPIPPGWALDARGRSIRSGRRAAEQRRLTPLGSTRRMGSHKGYGLAAAMEILAGVLPGSRPAAEAGATKREIGHFFVAIDPSRFRDGDGFDADLAAMVESLRESRAIDPSRPVRVAGDLEHATHARRSSSGIPLSRSVVEDVREVARKAGAPFLLDASQ